ncbi:MAG TPA: M14 family metallopeptidase [Armatimonadaceae bacterium]|nr:M14 family metallopeptidase [Armatimonadaceae bacterium]
MTRRRCLRALVLLAALAVVPTAAGADAPPKPFALAPAPKGWELTAERTRFDATGRYAEAVAFCRKLEKASPYAKVVRYGTSPQGREMVALILSRDKAFTPEAARRAGKPVVVLNNGIHSGEIEGKDADLILARDILVTKARASLLDGVTLVLIPVFSVDAHEERFGAHNRVNQNGPREMGWRSTSVNLNLNRDFVKADAGEMRALLGLIRAWDPDFLFDNHTTNGGDWRYSVLFDVPSAPSLHPGVAAWAMKMRVAVAEAVEKDGFLTAPYFSLRDPGKPEGGLSVQDFEPRYAHGYMTARNRPSMLVETHMLKPYAERVAATYSVNARTLAYIGANAKQLLDAVRAADSTAAATRPGDRFVLTSQATAETRPFLFRGLAYAPFESPITGGAVHAWTREPKDTPTMIRDAFATGLSVAAPAAYAIPPQYAEVIARLDLHGLRYTRLAAPITDAFDTYRFEEVAFPPAPFEGRFRPRFRTVPIRERRTLPAGTVLVSVAQPRAKLLLHLLEPDAPDSLLSWGFFNGIFASPEYAEEYAMEPIARRMLAADPALKAAYEERLKDPAFAADRRARLAFFYERSPYFDGRKDKYPIVRLTLQQLQGIRRR